MRNVAKKTLFCVGVIIAICVSVILFLSFGLLFNERERYLDTIYPEHSIQTDQHNISEYDGFYMWDFVYQGANVFFISRDSSKKQRIVKKFPVSMIIPSPKDYTEMYQESYIVAYTQDDFDLYVADKEDLIFQEINFKGRIVAASWIQSKFVIFSLNDDDELEVHWFHNNEIWKPSNSYNTKQKISSIYNTQVIDDLGIYLSYEKGLIFISEDETNFDIENNYKKLSQVFGSKKFYIMEYEKDTFQIFELYLYGNLIFKSNYNTEKFDINTGELIAQEKENERDENKLNNIERIEVYDISSADNTIKFKKGVELYSIKFP